MTITHKRKDGKVDVDLQFISQDGTTAVYHRNYALRNGERVTVKWGACSTERFNREFVPC